MAYLQINHLSCNYGNTAAVTDLNLSVEAGEFISLLGPSGCGKTTTLKLIAGLVSPSQGDIMLSGNPLNNVPVNKRQIGFVFQQFALFPHMTVRENIGFGLKMAGLSPAQRHPAVDSMLQRIQMTALADRMPSELSGGQQQRVALGRTLVTEPDLLLLDEPFANLDANLRADMRTFVRELQQETGVTTILVTHDQQEAMEMSDRLALMHKGKLVQYDSPAAVYSSPVNIKAGLFMGELNQLNLVRKGDQWITDLGAINLSEFVTIKSDHALLVIRPENVRLTIGAPADKTVLSGPVSIINRQRRGVLERFVLEAAGTKLVCLLMPDQKFDFAQQPIYFNIFAKDAWLISN